MGNALNRSAKPKMKSSQQLALVTRFDQRMDQGGGGGEADAVALLAGGEPWRKRDMGLAGSAVAEQQHVLSAGEELAPRQLQHHGLVERRHGEEVEAVQALGRGELRLSYAAFGGATFAVEQLELGHAQQVAWIVKVSVCPRSVRLLRLRHSASRCALNASV